MSFNSAAVNSLFAEIVSQVQVLGVFDYVTTHEPKSAPQTGLSASIWMDGIIPVGRASGLNSTSGQVVFNIRCYTSMLSQPYDDIDPRIMTAVTTLLDRFSGHFTLDGTVREVDLLGIYGKSLSAQAGYVNTDGKWNRTVTVTVPVTIDDMYSQEA